MTNSISPRGNGITVELDIILMEEDGVCIAYCPALELSSFGDDASDAKKAFMEAMSIFFEEVVKKGTLEKVLLQLGWTLRALPKPKYLPPPFSRQNVKKLSNRKFSISPEKYLIPAHC